MKGNFGGLLRHILLLLIMLWKQYIRFRLKAQIYLIFNGLVTAKLRQSDITFVKKKKVGDGVVKFTFDSITVAKVAVETGIHE